MKNDISNMSVRCKSTSKYNITDVIEYNFNCTVQLFNRLIGYLKYIQLCNVLEMENVDRELLDAHLVISSPNLYEKYFTLYVVPEIFEFYMYLDPVRDQILQISDFDSLTTIFKIIDSVADPFNDPKVSELFDDMYALDNPIAAHYPAEALKYSIINEFHDIIPEVINSMKLVK